MNNVWLLCQWLVASVSASELPLRVDNSQSDFFPPVVRQTFESCAQQVGLYAMTSFALNRARSTSAQRPDNQLAPRFAWNFLNQGKNRGSELVEGWQLMQAMGCPSIADATLAQNEWLNGYPKYLKAMQHRVRSFEFFEIDSKEGVRQAKGLLHAASQSKRAQGGLLAIEGRLEGATMITIPKESHEAGKNLVLGWGQDQGPGHLMTYVGYDDAVGHDVNGDGRLSNDLDITGDGKVTLADWERGAFLAVNSFGTEWGDQGKCYVMVREFAVTNFRRGRWAATVRVWPQYHPQLTLKIAFKTSNRSGVHLSVGAKSGSELHTPLIFSHGMAAFALPETLPESPEKYSGYLLGKSRLGNLPARVKDGQSAAIEMGFDLSGQVPLQEYGYQLRLKTTTAEVDAAVLSASICHYLPNGRLIEERAFLDLPASIGPKPLTLFTP